MADEVDDAGVVLERLVVLVAGPLVVEADRDTGAALLLRTYQMPLRKPPPASASTRMSSKRRDRLTGRRWVLAGRSVSVGAYPAWKTPQRHESTLFGTRRPHF
jgi:hypothetical protein